MPTTLYYCGNTKPGHVPMQMIKENMMECDNYVSAVMALTYSLRAA
jgi:hypothetical protein